MTYDVIARARRTTRIRVTAACLAAAAVAGIATAAVVFLAGTDQPGAAPTATASAQQPGTGSSDAATAGLPADLTFADVAGVSVPVSKRSGPFTVGEGLARGFAHDRGGAVLAAAHIVVRVSPQLGPQVFDPTLRTQVVGPDAAALRLQIAEQYETLRGAAGVAYGQPVGRLYATLRGYRLDQYSDEQATVALLIAADDSQGRSALTVSTVQLQWTGTDWALIAPAGGTFEHTVALVGADQASRYVPFTPGR